LRTPNGWDLTAKNYGGDNASFSFGRKLPTGGFVSVKAGVAWVEASLPKRVDDSNIHGLSLVEADQVVREMVEEATEFVQPTAYKTQGRKIKRERNYLEQVAPFSAANPKIVRLDLVRDFNLRDPEALPVLLNGLSFVSHAGRTKVRRFADGARGGAQTLSVGPKAWKANLYDKNAETEALARRFGGDRPVAPPGSLRFEARLHQAQLRSVAGQQAAGREIWLWEDLTETSAEGLRKHWFERVGFDREVISVAGVWPRVKASGLSPREQAVFVGWLDARSRGESLELGRDTERKYRNLANDLGIVCALEAPQRTVTMKLDYESGRELVKVA
jgi:hypothetical protein